MADVIELKDVRARRRVARGESVLVNFIARDGMVVLRVNDHEIPMTLEHGRELRNRLVDAISTVQATREPEKGAE